MGGIPKRLTYDPRVISSSILVSHVLDLAGLQREVEASPDAHQARFDLALALAARGDRGQAVDHLIELRKRDKDWNEDGARKQLLQFFDAWGVMDPDTIRGRRKLSALLFS